MNIWINIHMYKIPYFFESVNIKMVTIQSCSPQKWWVIHSFKVVIHIGTPIASPGAWKKFFIQVFSTISTLLSTEKGHLSTGIQPCIHIFFIHYPQIGGFWRHNAFFYPQKPKVYPQNSRGLSTVNRRLSTEILFFNSPDSRLIHRPSCNKHLLLFTIHQLSSYLSTGKIELSTVFEQLSTV